MKPSTMLKLLLPALTISAFAIAAPLQTRRPSDNDDFARMDSNSTATQDEGVPPLVLEIFDTPEQLQRTVAPLFDTHVDRNEAEKILRRAIDMLHHRPARARGPNYDEPAKRLLRRMVGDPNIGSTSSEESHQSPKKKGTEDPDCELPSEGHGRRVIADSTKRRILKLHDEGKSLDIMRKQYPWFSNNYLERFRQSRHTDEGSQRCRMEQINEYVMRRAE